MMTTPGVSFVRAARFPDEGLAAEVYFELQELLRVTRADLSVYRLLMDGEYHVTTLGHDPGREIEEEIGQLLASGVPAPLPHDVIEVLSDRRLSVTAQANWAEGHYRPA